MAAAKPARRARLMSGLVAYAAFFLTVTSIYTLMNLSLNLQ